MALRNILEPVLTHRRLPLWLAFLAVLLVLSSVWTGWQMDDITHRYMLLGRPDFQGRSWVTTEMFSFLKGDSARTRGMVDLGLLPWWTLDRIRLSFWRPLTALTHRLDYMLWPDNAVLMHAQNLLWFGALIALVALLYRQFHGTVWVAGLAGLLYAIDDAHGLSAGWLAGRNTMMAALFGVVVILWHDRWRRHRWRAGAWLAPAALALGLLAGEFALGAVAYLVAHAIFLDPAPPRARIRALLPYLPVLVAWFAVYKYLGNGTWGSGFYVDPIAEPAAFAVAFLERAPLLLLDQFGFPPSSVSIALSAPQLAFLRIWALAFLSLVAIVLLPVFRDRTARFWAAGMVLSLPPICATQPGGRLLYFTGLGGMALLAMWFGARTAGDAAKSRGTGARIFHRGMFIVLVVVHFVLAPLLLPRDSLGAALMEPYLQRPAKDLPADPGIGERDLIIVNPPVVFFSNFLSAVRLLDGDPVPRRVRALAPGTVPLHVARRDERTLVIRPEGGFLDAPFDNVFRGPGHPMHPGDTVALTNLTIRVVTVTADGRPDEVAFEFSTPLGDPSLSWLRWGGERYEPFTPPPVGSGVVLPAAKFF